MPLFPFVYSPALANHPVSRADRPANVAASQAQSTFDIVGRRLSHKPKIDGVITPSEWSEAEHREGFYDSGTGTESEEKGEFWIAYDQDALYIAGRFVTNPRKVIADEYRPNSSVDGNDSFGIAIDPNGGQNFNKFGFNASTASTIQLAGGRAAKIEWLGELESQGRITSTGWEVEARIPWGVMNMPSKGTHAMRFNLAWYRSNKHNDYDYLFTNAGNQAWPMLTGIETPSFEHKRSVKLLPYGYAGVDPSNNLILNSGLDAKVPLTDKINLVGTINPDFRNIENQILSLDFSYLPRLADEARPFFQEGSNYRSTGYYQRIFASQTVQDIDYGINLYGELDDKTQVGLLSTVDIGKQQAIVGSLSRQLTASDKFGLTYVGDLEPGIRNHVGLFEYQIQRGLWSTYTGVRLTQDLDTKTGVQTDASLNWGKNGAYFGIGETSVSRDFNPRLGFTPETDIQNYNANFGWRKNYTKGPLTGEFHNFNASTDTHVSGGFHSNSVNTYNEWTTRNLIELGVYQERSSFEGTHDQSFGVHLKYPSGDPYRYVFVQVDRSKYNDIDYRRFKIDSAYRPKKRVQASLSGEWVDYAGSQTQVIGSLRFDKGKYESYGVRLIRRDSDLTWSLSYSLSGRKGPEYYVALGDPNSVTFQRQLIFKAIIPFELVF